MYTPFHLRTKQFQPAFPPQHGKSRGHMPGVTPTYNYQHTRLPVQAKLTVNTPGDAYEQEADDVSERVVRGGGANIVRRVDSGTGVDIPATFSSELHAAGSGSALPESTRRNMETGFGADFSSVRIHADPLAADMSGSIKARAFTHGQDIYFNQGAFAPDTWEGRKLLAHELTHVVQQGKGESIVQRDDADAAVEKQKIEALVEKIKKYGIIAVENDTANFTSAELDLADKAFAGLPAKDKTAIKGAKLVRVQSLGSTTAGQYTNTQSYNGTQKTDEQKIELSDKAFASNITSDESIRLITHEVGHAVAAMPHRIAESEVLNAGVKFNQLVDEANQAVDVFNASNDDYNAAVDVSNAAVEVYNAAIKGTDKAAITAAKADMDKKKAETARLSGIRSQKETEQKTKKAASNAQETVLKTKEAAAQSKIANIDDLKADATAKLTSMETAFAASKSILSSSDTESADYRTAVTAVQEAIKKFYQENVDVEVEESVADSAKAVVDAAIKDRNDKRMKLNTLNASNPVLNALTALETAQDKCFKAATIVAMNRSMSLSVKRFYDFIVKNSISPALTAYAAENWPHKPEEFYAEAYSYFVNKPTDLEKYSKPLYDWFKAGKYQ